MMRKGRRSKPPGVGICRVLMVVRRAGCVSFSPASRLAQIGTVWSALETQPLWARTIDVDMGVSPPYPPGNAEAGPTWRDERCGSTVIDSAAPPRQAGI